MDSLKLYINGDKVDIKRLQFPAGETLIALPINRPWNDARIILDFTSNNDLFDLALLVDAIRRHDSFSEHEINISLTMRYIPYARQDRVCNPGESLSIKVVADFINSLNFKSVCAWDCHSDVTLALFNNMEHISQDMLVYYLAVLRKGAVLVSPDVGAQKKIFKFSKAHPNSFDKVICADKVRDPASGNIVSTSVNCEHIGDKDFLIMDDICDGGRTFIELAKVLRPLTNGDIYLYVTHGIFSAGLSELKKHFKAIYVAQLVGSAKSRDDIFIEVL